jgi:hypothetical protein
MRTVVAVTEPLLADGPNADTQSPTARALDATAWVVFTGVELVVVTLSVSVLSLGGFLLLLFLAADTREPKFPPEIEMPETVRVVPLTAVTLPDAMSRSANCLAKFPAPDPLLGKLGRVPLPSPPRNWKPPAGGPPGPLPTRKAPPPALPVAPQVPLLFGVVKVMLRAAMVVLDFLEADPVAVTQSPTVMALTVFVADWEKVVVGVQFTVV